MEPVDPEGTLAVSQLWLDDTVKPSGFPEEETWMAWVTCGLPCTRFSVNEVGESWSTGLVFARLVQ